MAAHHTYVFNTHGTKCVFKWPKIKLISQCSISSQNSLNKLLVLGHLNRPGRLHIQLNPHFTHKISTYTCIYMCTHTHTHTHTDRQTHATENITFPHSRLVIIFNHYNFVSNSITVCLKR